MSSDYVTGTISGDITSKASSPQYKIVSTGKIKDIQAKYGVVVTQPKYGVQYSQPAYGVPIIQPSYGVQIVQPKYGVIYPYGPDIDITYSQLEENISTLKKAIANLKDAWDSQTKQNISKLENSWVGDDCRVYTQKLTKMDTKVQKTISALELLCSTYEKARDMVKENQSSTISSINNM